MDNTNPSKCRIYNTDVDPTELRKVITQIRPKLYTLTMNTFGKTMENIYPTANNAVTLSNLPPNMPNYKMIDRLQNHHNVKVLNASLPKKDDFFTDANQVKQVELETAQQKDKLLYLSEIILNGQTVMIDDCTDYLPLPKIKECDEKPIKSKQSEFESESDSESYSDSYSESYSDSDSESESESDSESDSDSTEEETDTESKQDLNITLYNLLYLDENNKELLLEQQNGCQFDSQGRFVTIGYEKLLSFSNKTDNGTAMITVIDTDYDKQRMDTKSLTTVRSYLFWDKMAKSTNFKTDKIVKYNQRIFSIYVAKLQQRKQYYGILLIMLEGERKVETQVINKGKCNGKCEAKVVFKIMNIDKYFKMN